MRRYSGLLYWVILSVAVASSSCDNHNILMDKFRYKELNGLEVNFQEGDDGMEIYNLKIEKVNNRFVAKEVNTDNYSNLVPHFQVNDSLSESDIQVLRRFLNNALTLSNSCEAKTSYKSEIRIKFQDQLFQSEYDCPWKGFGYHSVRQKLFSIDY